MPTTTAWALHDINDVEALVRKRLNTLSTFTNLQWTDQEDAVSGMLEAVIKLETSWKGESTFSHFVWKSLPNKLIDYLRKYHVDLRNPHEANAQVTLTEDMSVFDQPYWDDEDSYPTAEHLLDGINLDSLSIESAQCLFDFAIPLARGQNIDDLAKLHGLKTRTILSRLAVLKEEIECLQDPA